MYSQRTELIQTGFFVRLILKLKIKRQRIADLSLKREGGEKRHVALYIKIRKLF